MFFLFLEETGESNIINSFTVFDESFFSKMKNKSQYSSMYLVPQDIYKRLLDSADSREKIKINLAFFDEKFQL